jgi:hypothetical protein
MLLGCREMVREGNAGPGPEVSYSLTVIKSNVVQRIGPELREPEKQKFVQIELTRISNPNKQPLIFEVYFLAQNGDKTFLGTFSPYPPDNPGKFIVPTKGRLRNDGAVVLSMLLPNTTESKCAVSIKVRKFTFRER